MAALQTKLRSHNTNPLIIQGITALLNGHHQANTPQYLNPLFYKRRQQSVLHEVFQQQQRLGPNAILRGLIDRNWMVLQNLHSSSPPDHLDLLWLSNLIKTLWTYSHSVWVARCKHVNQTTADEPISLTQAEQMSIIRQYLKLPRDILTREEKRLHLNISRGMRSAHTTTLAHWIHLLREVRAEAIRNQSSGRPIRQSMQSITKYFRRTKKK